MPGRSGSSGWIRLGSWPRCAGGWASCSRRVGDLPAGATRRAHPALRPVLSRPDRSRRAARSGRPDRGRACPLPRPVGRPAPAPGSCPGARRATRAGPPRRADGGHGPGGEGVHRELITELRENGVTALLTTDELADVERLADRVVIMARGRIVAAGSPAELAAGRTAGLRFGLEAALPAADRRPWRRRSRRWQVPARVVHLIRRRPDRTLPAGRRPPEPGDHCHADRVVRRAGQRIVELLRMGRPSKTLPRADRGAGGRPSDEPAPRRRWRRERRPGCVDPGPGRHGAAGSSPRGENCS